MAAKGHTSLRDLTLYVFDLLSEDEKSTIDSHISECPDCFLKLVDLRYRKIQACRNVAKLFSKAYEEKLSPDEQKLWNAHIKACDKCFEDYSRYMKEREKGLGRILLGKLKDLLENLEVPFPVPTEGVVLSADSETRLEIDKLVPLKKKRLQAHLALYRNGTVKFFLDPGGIGVLPFAKLLFLKKRRDREEPLRVIDIDPDGVADLGRLNELLSESLKGSSLVLDLTKEPDEE